MDDTQEDVQNIISTLKDNGFNLVESEEFSKSGPSELKLNDFGFLTS